MFSIIKYLDFLVDCIRRFDPWTMTTLKKKNFMKSKEFGSSSTSPKAKQAVSYEFYFVEDDVVMIFPIYFLDCSLLGKLKNLYVCRKALLLASDWDKFNSYP